ALTGFVDAGNATYLAREHLLGALEPRLVATFDADQLIDYRARRPPMIFLEDHWEQYEEPALELHLLHDDAGTPFLLLAGPDRDPALGGGAGARRRRRADRPERRGRCAGTGTGGAVRRVRARPAGYRPARRRRTAALGRGARRGAGAVPRRTEPPQRPAPPLT